MAIPASHIVQINPRVLQPGGTDLQINGLFFTKSDLQPLSAIVMEFPSASSVGDYYGTASDEYKYATKYFLGYDNSFAKPRRLMIARRISEDIPAWLRGGRFAGTLAQLKEITDGGLKITIDSKAASISAVDLSACNSFSDVAAAVQTKITAVEGLDDVVCTYSSLTRAFQITSGTAGAESAITFASAPDSGTDLADTLMLTAAKGALVSAGADAMDVAANMAAIREITDNWVCFTTLYVCSDDESLEFARWATTQGVDYLYLPWSADVTLTQQGISGIAEMFADANVAATALQYCDTPELSAFIAGSAASIDWNRRQGTITFAFKGQSGIPANVKTEAEALTLEGKRANYYGDFATRNDNFIFLQRGVIFGDYKFIDSYINAVWLKNVMQVAIMSGLKQSPRVPYNEMGYTKIRAWLMDPINRAKKCGVIDAGVELSELQKAEIASEAGRDISGEIYRSGYVVQVEDAGAHVRVDRDSPNVSVWYTYGGSVQRVVVASTALL